MMVSEGHMGYVLAIRLNILKQLARGCYTGYQQHIRQRCFCIVCGLIVEVDIRYGISLWEDGLQRTILQCGEEKVLIGEEVHVALKHAIGHRFHLGRTFRDYHDIGPILAVNGFTQTAGRQKHIVSYDAMIICQQNVDARFDITVLKSIIKQYHINILSLRGGKKGIYTMTPLGIYSHINIWELFVNLIGFVTYLFHLRIGVS